MTARQASSFELIGFSNKLLHAEIMTISGLQCFRPSKCLYNIKPALSDPPGLHEAELQGSVEVVVGLQGYLWGCKGYLWGCRIAELYTGLQGVPAGLQGYVEGCRGYLQGCKGYLWDCRGYLWDCRG